MLMLTLSSLVILLIIGSARTLFFLGGAKSTSPTPISHSSSKSALLTSNSIVGQALFISSDQIGTDYNTGICDELQVYLNRLAPQEASKSYYAWLLPDGVLSEESPTAFLGRLTVNNGVTSMTYTNPAHKNLLLTDLVANANSAFVGQLDPATSARQGGATWVHDVLPQLATLNVKEAS